MQDNSRQAGFYVACGLLCAFAACNFQSPIASGTGTPAASGETSVDVSNGTTSSSNAPLAPGVSNSVSGVVGALVSPETNMGFALRWKTNASLCLATRSGTPASGDTLVLANCTQALNQQFYWSNGKWRTALANFCVGFGNVPAAVGTQLVISPCSTADMSQTWVFSGDMFQTGATKPLAVAPMLDANQIYRAQLMANSNDLSQQFSVDPNVSNLQGVAISATTSTGAVCMAMVNGHALTQTCNQGAVQQLWTLSGGRLYSAGNCLQWSQAQGLTTPSCDLADLTNITPWIFDTSGNLINALAQTTGAAAVNLALTPTGVTMSNASQTFSIGSATLN